jgi:hypothetical protein
MFERLVREPMSQSKSVTKVRCSLERSCMLGELVKTNEPWREAAADHHGTISF